MIEEKIGLYSGKFFPLHRGHLDCIIKASCMVDKLYIIINHNEKAERELCEGNKFVDKAKIKYEQLTPRTRITWLCKALKDIDNIVIKEVSNDYGSFEDTAVEIRKIIGKNPDYIFSSEPTYDSIFKSLYPRVKHIIFDKGEIPISSTQIRLEGVYKHWDYLPKPVQADFVKKVAIIGLDKTGKTTLTRNLANKYNTEYVEDYMRNLFDCNNGLLEEVYPTILYQHNKKEYEITKKANKLLFIDSESITTQYSLKLYNPILDEIAKNQDYDLYLFLEPHIEEEKERNNELKAMFDKVGIKYICIDGNYLERFNKVCKLVERLLG